VPLVVKALPQPPGGPASLVTTAPPAPTTACFACSRTWRNNARRSRIAAKRPERLDHASYQQSPIVNSLSVHTGQRRMRGDLISIIIPDLFSDEGCAIASYVVAAFDDSCVWAGPPSPPIAPGHARATKKMTSNGASWRAATSWRFERQVVVVLKRVVGRRRLLAQGLRMRVDQKLRHLERDRIVEAAAAKCSGNHPASVRPFFRRRRRIVGVIEEVDRLERAARGAHMQRKEPLVRLHFQRANGYRWAKSSILSKGRVRGGRHVQREAPAVVRFLQGLGERFGKELDIFQRRRILEGRVQRQRHVVRPGLKGRVPFARHEPGHPSTGEE
jgi:hypothetical protein